MATTFAGADGAVASYPTQSRRSDMAVAKINRKLSAIDLSLDSLVLPLRVGDVTEEDWEAFLDHENQVLKSKYMVWIEGAILIVELPTREHDDFGQEFDRQLVFQPAVRACLAAHGSGYMKARPRLPKLEPDQSYGPDRATVLPRGVRCVADWITLVLEVGKSQEWGLNPGSLDWKARQWTRFAGVRFILCVSVTDSLASAEYKLYTVVLNNQNRARTLPNLDPLPVVAPQTMVWFNSHELLGLPPTANLPMDPRTGQQFPGPTIGVDLYAALVTARLRY